MGEVPTHHQHQIDSVARIRRSSRQPLKVLSDTNDVSEDLVHHLHSRHGPLKAPAKARARADSLLITIELFQRFDDAVMVVITMLRAVGLAVAFIGRCLAQRLLRTAVRIQSLGSGLVRAAPHLVVLVAHGLRNSGGPCSLSKASVSALMASKGRSLESTEGWLTDLLRVTCTERVRGSGVSG